MRMESETTGSLARNAWNVPRETGPAKGRTYARIKFDGRLLGGVQPDHCDASDLTGPKIALYHHQHACHQYKIWERWRITDRQGEK